MPWQNPGPHGFVPPGAPRRPDGSYYKPAMDCEMQRRGSARNTPHVGRMNPSSYAGFGFTLVLVFIILGGILLAWLT